MAGQHNRGEEKEWEVAGLRGLQRLEQGLPEGSFPYAVNRLIGGFDRETPSNEFLRCLLRLPSDTPGCRGPRINGFCHPCWKLPLQGNALWLEECRVDLPEDDDQDV